MQYVYVRTYTVCIYIYVSVYSMYMCMYPPPVDVVRGWKVGIGGAVHTRHWIIYIYMSMSMYYVLCTML